MNSTSIDGKPDVKQAMAAAGLEWPAFVEPLLSVGSRLTALLDDPHDAWLRQELYQFIFSQIAAGYIGLLHASAEHPDFWPSHHQVFNQGFPNPDDVYYMTPVDGAGLYRVSGFRGTARVVNFIISGGTLVPFGTGDLGQTFASRELDELKLEPGGAFEVLLSAVKPESWQGDWWRLDPGATHLIVRQICYDPLTEVDARLAIERLDTPASKPRPTAERIEELLKQIPAWAEGYMTYYARRLRGLRELDLVNRVHVKGRNDTGGIPNQQYVEGFFDIRADEALILETDVPTCRYWNFQLSDLLHRSLGMLHHQSSINGHLAHLDADGRFRAVISLEDPGVANWIDTAGYTKGMIHGRWKGCDCYPTPTITKVKLSIVRQRLPADTAIVTPAQREAAVRLRRTGMQLRRRW